MTAEVTTSAAQSAHCGLPDYDRFLRLAMSGVARTRTPAADFEPLFELPAPGPELARFLSAASLRFAGMGEVRGTRLILLDLMSHPGTRTVKTLASHVIVARAVRHVRATGEPVMIVTPSSANKATALRDAVARAYALQLADPDQLRITTLVPDASRPKLWSSELTARPGLLRRNPMCVLDPSQPAHVKSVALDAVTACRDAVFAQTGFRLWHTLDLGNYRCADAVRAWAENVMAPPVPGRTRAHAHAVSSAFGLLGHAYGGTLLEDAPEPGQYFLVQHLATPDMVLSLHGAAIPEYRHDPVSGLYHQQDDPRFPATTFAVDEDLEPTFYTRSPATSPEMNEIINRQGGGGIVVSLHECLSRYPEVRGLLLNAGVELPADPRALREWSLVMAMTGVLNALDRGLIKADEVVVHASGSYTAADYTPIPDEALRPVADAAGLAEVITAAAGEPA
ncbi:DUF6002 family protein [Catenulispora subtropica]|uniref:Uncharacterized protein n=1 Tax=Catenulispora subtropica TaxID=450798 RepID=A0ABN2T245_9ACTN